MPHLNGDQTRSMSGPAILKGGPAVRLSWDRKSSSPPAAALWNGSCPHRLVALKGSEPRLKRRRRSTLENASEHLERSMHSRTPLERGSESPELVVRLRPTGPVSCKGTAERSLPSSLALAPSPKLTALPMQTCPKYEMFIQIPSPIGSTSQGGIQLTLHLHGGMVMLVNAAAGMVSPTAVVQMGLPTTTFPDTCKTRKSGPFRAKHSTNFRREVDTCEDRLVTRYAAKTPFTWT